MTNPLTHQGNDMHILSREELLEINSLIRSAVADGTESLRELARMFESGTVNGWAVAVTVASPDEEDDE